MKGLVLDTNALFYGKDFPEGYELVISPRVVRELEREGMTERLEMLLATRVRVSSPGRRSSERVARAAEESGDVMNLSDTDLEILALALELGYELRSDDYAVQNVASIIGVPCRGIDQAGIKSVWAWEAKCTGCGKVFSARQKECDVCGHPTRPKRKLRK